MARDNAERVVAGAGKRQISGRECWPPPDYSIERFFCESRCQDLQLEIEHLTRDEATKSAWFLAAVVGQALARQLDTPAKKKWLDELKHYRSAKLEAPSWLWSGIVELLVRHEGEYLEHWRHYAMQPVVS